MPIPDPFTVISLSAGIIVNLASDILKYRTQSIKNPLIVRAFRWAGLREVDLSERIQNILTEALLEYFESHKAYQIQGVIDFFKNPNTAHQLADYILDGEPINQTELQLLLEQSLGIVPHLIIEKRGLDIDKIIPDFLASYHRVLRQSLSTSELALMSKLLELGQEIIEIKGSEDRLKEFITSSLRDIKPPQGLQTTNQAPVIIGKSIDVPLELALIYEACINLESINKFVKGDLADVLSIVDNGKLKLSIHILKQLSKDNWDFRNLLSNAIAELEKAHTAANNSGKWSTPLAVLASGYRILQPKIARKNNYKCAIYAAIGGSMCCLALGRNQGAIKCIDKAQACITPYHSVSIDLNYDLHLYDKGRYTYKKFEKPIHNEANRMEDLVQRLRDLL